MCARHKLTVILTVCSLFLSAQARFGVDVNYRLLNKPVNAGILHHFIQARNYTGDTLQMRWVKSVQGNPPAAWTVNFADPQQNHPDISALDSADFTFPDSSNWVYNKFVIGINPNGAAGSAIWRFNIFEKQNPADSLQIEYEVIVTDAIGLQQQIDEWSIYPNPAQHFILLKGWPVSAEGVLLINSRGQRFKTKSVEVAEGLRLAVHHLPKGTYYIQSPLRSKAIIKKIIIQ